jgi:hypothetical protein
MAKTTYKLGSKRRVLEFDGKVLGFARFVVAEERVKGCFGFNDKSTSALGHQRFDLRLHVFRVAGAIGGRDDRQFRHSLRDKGLLNTPRSQS